MKTRMLLVLVVLVLISVACGSSPTPTLTRNPAILSPAEMPPVDISLLPVATDRVIGTLYSPKITDYFEGEIAVRYKECIAAKAVFGEGKNKVSIPPSGKYITLCPSPEEIKTPGYKSPNQVAVIGNVYRSTEPRISYFQIQGIRLARNGVQMGTTVYAPNFNPDKQPSDEVTDWYRGSDCIIRLPEGDKKCIAKWVRGATSIGTAPAGEAIGQVSYHIIVTPGGLVTFQPTSWDSDPSISSGDQGMFDKPINPNAPTLTPIPTLTPLATRTLAVLPTFTPKPATPKP